MLASPLLTRLYTPEDFGLLAVYMSLTAILSTVVAMRYEQAIALPEDEREAMRVAAVSQSFVLLTSLVTLLVVIFWRHGIAERFGLPELGKLLWALPVSMLFLGSFSVAYYWCVRIQAYGVVGNARIRQVIASLVAQLSLFSFGPAGLIAGQVANQTSGTWLLFKRLPSWSRFRTLTRAELFETVSRYRRFPLISTWAILLNRVSSQLPPLLFAVLFGAGPAGLYALAMRVLNAPSGIVSKALTSVFLSTAAEAYREGRLGTLTAGTYRRLTLISLPSMMLIAVIAEPLFAIVFGSQWQMAGAFAAWLTIQVFFSIVVAPLTTLYYVLERQTQELWFQGSIFIVRLVALLIGSHYGDAVLAVALFSTFSAVVYSGFLAWAFISSGAGLASLCVTTLQGLLAGAVICVPALVGRLNSTAETGRVDSTEALLVMFSGLLLLAFLYVSVRYSRLKPTAT